ncbi:MAG TPA: hypothetical protein PLS12_11940, partial [Bacteroidales bacterium]|nr:hypothetical protein [Bacteroidales bacterium]
MKHIIIAALLFVMFGCEKECYEERDTLPQFDASKVVPNGIYILDEAFSKELDSSHKCNFLLNNNLSIT